MADKGEKFDTDLYTPAENKFAGYNTTIPADDDEDQDMTARAFSVDDAKRELAEVDEDGGAAPDPFDEYRRKSVYEREDAYHKRRMDQFISPARPDPFADQTPGPETRTYKDIMAEQQLRRDEAEVQRKIQQKLRQQADEAALKKAAAAQGVELPSEVGLFI